MTYQDCLEFLYEKLPMYQRVGAPAYKKDLTNTIQLLEAIGNPHKRIKTIHIAGTNGKGSSAHALASVLQEAGYKVGLYTSPHLKRFTERIRINGVEIGQSDVVSFVEGLLPVIDSIAPSFFELTVVMAFDYFANEQVDIAVIETGLGGRLDSTNVITPEVALITNIGWDHMDILGDTLPDIAAEKAGIIKPDVPTVLGSHQEEVNYVFEQKADQAGSILLNDAKDYRIVRRKRDIEYVSYSISKSGFFRFNIESDVTAEYFIQNIPGVLEVIEVLNQAHWNIAEHHIVKGFRNIIANTGLKGRYQVLSRKPLVIADISHNLDGLKALFQQVVSSYSSNLIIIYGTVKDKSLEDIISILPKGEYLLTQSHVPRSMPVDELSGIFDQHGMDHAAFENVNKALSHARQLAKASDVILVCGSTFVVAEIDEL